MVTPDTTQTGVLESLLAGVLTEVLADKIGSIEPDRLLTAAQVGELLARDDGSPVTTVTVVNLAKQGAIPGRHLGDGLGWRFSQRSIMDWFGCRGGITPAAGQDQIRLKKVD